MEYSRRTLGEGSGTTSELLIQTPQSGNNLLTVDSLLTHYKAVHKATQITVNMYDM